MSSFSNYVRMASHIKNWRLYFKRLNEKGQIPRYITKGVPLQFDVPTPFFHVFKEMFLEDFYHINDMLQHIPQKPVVVDIGANVGYFAFQLLSKRAGAMIYAYEPMKVNVDVFKHNISLNKGLENQAKVFEQAVTGNTTGFINFFFDDVNHNSVIGSVFNDFSEDNKQSKQVPAIPLYEIIAANNLTTIDLLKLDCEGSEYPILYDSPDSVFNVIKMMAIEVHELDSNTRNSKALTQFLTEKGYQVHPFMAANECYYLKVIKQ